MLFFLSSFSAPDVHDNKNVHLIHHVRVPTHLENLEFGLELHAWKNHGISKMDIFIENHEICIQLSALFSPLEYILQNLFFCQLCFFISLIIEYCWLYVPNSFDLLT